MVELDRDPDARANPLAVALEFDPILGWCVRARGLRPDLVVRFGGRMESLLRVRVTEAMNDGYLPNVLGDHEVLDDGVRFAPLYPFEPGVRFRAVLDLRVLKRAGLVEVQTLEFSIPKDAGAGDTEVSQVFPSSDLLPENLLRFYVRFSRPMKRGGAEKNITVLGPDGEPTPDVLYRAPVELWDSSMTCLTVLLDPGRLKRGVGPNRMLGPPLRSGLWNTLSIAPGIIDVDGCPTVKGFRKTFRVSDAVREPIAFERWSIEAPAKGTLEPLELNFPKPLDWAQLWRGITIAEVSGKPISGRIDIDLGETQWKFTPEAPWQAGSYDVRISPALEDICGNTPYGPFDAPFRSCKVAIKTGIGSLPFAVTAA
jgi:hypothetical protein